MVQAIQMDRWVSAETTVHPWMGPAYFNSRLSTEGAGAGQNAKLTIYLRVWLEPVGPETPKSFCIDWPRLWNRRTNEWLPVLDEWHPSRFELFRYHVKQRSDSFWSCRNPDWGNPGFCLMPLGDWDGLDWPLGCKPTHRLNVDCDFELVFANGRDDAHIMFYCVNPKWNPGKDGVFPAFARPGTAERTGVGLLALQNAISFRTECSGALLPSGACLAVNGQYAVPHEIGHALGMPHIGVSLGSRACMDAAMGAGITRFFTEIGLRQPDQNVDQCIGDSVEDASNVMGIGSGISSVNALPWLLRLTQHTRTSPRNWMICMGKRPPTPL
jgi:hypothetical protein